MGEEYAHPHTLGHAPAHRERKEKITKMGHVSRENGKILGDQESLGLNIYFWCTVGIQETHK